MRVTYCEPFNGRLALNARVFARIKGRIRRDGLYGRTLTELDLFAYLAREDGDLLEDLGFVASPIRERGVSDD